MRPWLMMDDFQPFAERESRNWSERQDIIQDVLG